MLSHNKNEMFNLMLRKTVEMKLVKILLLLFFCNHLPAQDFTPDMLNDFQYRNLGAYRVGAWISAIAVPETNDPAYAHTFYVAARNGGVWKTENKGTTFSPVFDMQNTNAIGDVAISPSNPEVVWVGTGEDYNARSSYSGTGIYKSVDGGDNWANMGLGDSHHISEIIIHPTNSDIVYVAVMGHLFSDNQERGVYKTIDGGKTWKTLLQISEQTGIIDIAIHPENSDILYAVAYDMDRSPWHFEAGGNESGIYKTIDGGINWDLLENAFPKGKIGRIGIDIALSDPDQLYAVVENLNQRPLTDKEKADDLKSGVSRTSTEIGGEVYHTLDGGQSWRKVNPEDVDVSSKAAYSFNELFINPVNANNLFVLSETIASSSDGGKSWKDEGWPPKDLFANMFGDVRTMWIDPKDPRHMLIGSDGGLYVSYDAGITTDHLYNLPLGEIYNVAVDNQQPYNIYLGYQDHEIWKGPSNSWSGQVTLEDWTIVGLWDGMYAQIDPKDDRWLYITSQFGAHHRVDQKNATRVNIQPKNKDPKAPYRYTWDTPILISSFDSDVLYTGGQMLLKSTNKGDSWKEISPDLTTNDVIKIAGKGHIQYCTITTIAELTFNPNVLFVGTDDGQVHVTSDGGKRWQNLSERLLKSGAPADRWVSKIQASKHHESTVYVTQSGYRRDDFMPYIFKSSDLGQTWQNIASNLPSAPISVMIEDHKNPDLLFVGTDIGVYFTVNGGESWMPLKANMPTVPVRDLLIHARENDLVVATYGRGAFVADISFLQELDNTMLSADYHLFDIETKPARNDSEAGNWGAYELSGDRHLATANEPSGMVINYFLKAQSGEKVEIEITDIKSDVKATLKGENRKGINQVIWRSRNQIPGTYNVTLKVGGKSITKQGVLSSRIHYAVLNYKEGKK